MEEVLQEETGGYRTNAYKRDVSARDQYKRKKNLDDFSTVY